MGDDTRDAEGFRIPVLLVVHHVVPCDGHHRDVGCWHHVDNLLTLCHVCHVREHRRLADKFGIGTPLIGLPAPPTTEQLRLGA